MIIMKFAVDVGLWNWILSAKVTRLYVYFRRGITSVLNVLIVCEKKNNLSGRKRIYVHGFFDYYRYYYRVTRRSGCRSPIALSIPIVVCYYLIKKIVFWHDRVSANRRRGCRTNVAESAGHEFFRRVRIELIIVQRLKIVIFYPPCKSIFEY